jgi:hydrogenase maturation protease
MHDQRHFLTILGLGNILLQDEGFGVHFVNWFAERYNLPERVKLIDGGTLGFGLFDTITSCKNLIVVDAIKTDDEPGSIYRFTQHEMELSHPPATSAHEVEFADILCKAELIDQAPSAVFLCIVPQQYDAHKMQVGMTPLMHERFADMEKFLLKELAALDITPAEKQRHA